MCGEECPPDWGRGAGRVPGGQGRGGGVAGHQVPVLGAPGGGGGVVVVDLVVREHGAEGPQLGLGAGALTGPPHLPGLDLLDPLGGARRLNLVLEESDAEVPVPGHLQLQRGRAEAGAGTPAPRLRPRHPPRLEPPDPDKGRGVSILLRPLGGPQPPLNPLSDLL